MFVVDPDDTRPILLIEDNPMDVDLTLRAFTRNKVANPVQVARDGEEALAYFARWESGEALPVIVLLDINLPKVSGLQVLRQIKGHARLRKIPVVALTTSAHDADVAEAYRLGVNSYIVKPVEFEKFR